MDFPNFYELRAAAGESVARDPSAKKLIAIHSGIPALISLALTALSYLLSLQISDTGGLGGLGTRSMLESLQMMLQVGNIAFTLFWSMSYVGIVTRWARGEQARTADLWEGFRQFGPVLRAGLLKGAVYFTVCFVAVQVSSIVYAASPVIEKYAVMFESMAADLSYMPSEEEMLAFLISYLPFLGIVMLLLCIPVVYRLRLMDFALMDQPKMGAFAAMRTSIVLTRHNCLNLFKLDLRFWWFYLLELAVACLYYGDWILTLAGVDLGLSPELLLFAACVVGLACQLALYIWRKNQVFTAYAMVYQKLKPPTQENRTND